MNAAFQNIEQIRKTKTLSREYMAQKLNVTLSAYGKMERGETSITIDRLYELAEIFGVEAEEILSFGKSKPGNVTYVPIEAQAGLLSGYAQLSPSPSSTYHLPFILGNDLHMIHAAGDSMLPTINPGDRIVIEQIKEMNNLKYGKVYVIQCADGLVIKRVYSSKKENKLSLRSDNQIYEPYEILKQDIISIWLVKGCFDLSLTPKAQLIYSDPKQFQNIAEK